MSRRSFLLSSSSEDWKQELTTGTSDAPPPWTGRRTGRAKVVFNQLFFRLGAPTSSDNGDDAADDSDGEGVFEDETNTLVLVQSNVNKTMDRLTGILNHGKTQREPADIIAIQEIPLRLDSKYLSGYRHIYRTDIVKLPDNTKETQTRQVSFFVRQLIPLVAVTWRWSDSAHKRTVETLTLKTDNGDVVITNVYNWHKERLNFTRLVNDHAAADNWVLLGDFNLHGEEWAFTRRKKPCPGGKKLQRAMRAAQMTY
ncbi:Zinc knuckle [Colletotrichum sp. SAR 10_70]|nr:Zinc knuckle [Colletotrichum sp. SAR 10_71]KAI8173773.1 Zinc knuckle [Colletotrichum sp. SAR 10_70]